MKAIYGLYATPQSAERAFKALRRAGVSEEQIAVMSSEPLENFDFGNNHHGSWMTWIAVLGAALGLGIAYLLTWMTQRSWPINTGGMPTVTNWTNMIILFELTMLGAALATVVTLLVSARLPRRLPEFYDPSISTGSILVGVTDASTGKTQEIEQALRSANPQALKEI
jgi:uncharacterized membrane protein YhdT